MRTAGGHVSLLWDLAHGRAPRGHRCLRQGESLLRLSSVGSTHPNLKPETVSVPGLTEVFRTHTVTTYPAPKSPGHQHWVSTSLGRHADAAAARILPVYDARGFWLGGSGLLPGPHSTAPGAAEAAPLLRALRIAVPLPLAHRRAKLLHRARLPSRLCRCRPSLRTCHA